MAKKLILIVEDNSELSLVLEQVLSESGYEVITSDLVASGYNIFINRKPNLVIVDINLPDGSGLELCKKIREHPYLKSTPVIILTAQNEIEEKIKGFSYGADQYLVKPLPASEIVMWVNALLRRVEFDKEGSSNKIIVGNLIVEKESMLVKYKGMVINNLTEREFLVFYALVEHRPNILSRKFILSKVWNTIAVDHLVDTHIYNLKKKLPPELADKIQSVPGKGFRFFVSE
jgi:two-component system alkaline phosphatase synthesis response regulator PhoP